MSYAISRSRRRSLHLVDIENLARTAFPTRTSVRTLMGSYRDTAQWRRGDLMIIGSSRVAWLHAAFDWELSHTWVARDGPDGGELALADAVRDYPLNGVERVVIGSGDGLLAATAARLAGRGVRVEAVARLGTLSKRLRLAVHEVRYMCFPEEPSREAA